MTVETFNRAVSGKCHFTDNYSDVDKTVYIGIAFDMALLARAPFYFGKQVAGVDARRRDD